MSCSGSNVFSMAGCGGCGCSSNVQALRNLSSNYDGSNSGSPCFQISSDANIAAWFEDYDFGSIADFPWGYTLIANFSSNTTTPASTTGPDNIITSYGCARYPTEWQREQAGFGCPYAYLILDIGVVGSGDPCALTENSILQGCTATGGASWWDGVGTLGGYYPVELGLPEIGTTQCGCRGAVVRVMTPINWTFSGIYVNGVATLAQFITALQGGYGGYVSNGVGTDGQLSSTLTYASGWNVGACQPPDEDPFTGTYDGWP